MDFRLKTARDRVKKSTIEEMDSWLRGRAAEYPAEVNYHPVESIDPSAAPAVAYVNYGHWVADCPSTACHICQGPCRGAMDLLPDRSAPFMCGCCYNLDFDGAWRPIRWPSELLHQRVEGLLRERPIDRHRNWYPWETLSRLRAENAANLPVKEL